MADYATPPAWERAGALADALEALASGSSPTPLPHTRTSEGMYDTADVAAAQAAAPLREFGRWLLHSYVRTHSYAHDAIAHYDDFLTRQLPRVLAEAGSFMTETEGGRTMSVALSDYRLRPPCATVVHAGSGSSAANTSSMLTDERLTPGEARAARLSYNAHVFMKATVTLTRAHVPACEAHRKARSADVCVCPHTEAGGGGPGTPLAPPMTFRDVHIMDVPCMVGCAACWTRLADDVAASEAAEDAGGYFIQNGLTYVAEPSCVPRVNLMRVYRESASGAVAAVLNGSAAHKAALARGGSAVLDGADEDEEEGVLLASDGVFDTVAEFRSLRADEVQRSSSTLWIRHRGADGVLRARLFCLDPTIHVALLFRLCHVGSREDILHYLSAVGPLTRRILDVLAPTLADPVFDVSDEEAAVLAAIRELTKNPGHAVPQALVRELFPHVGYGDSPAHWAAKAQQLAVMVYAVAAEVAGEPWAPAQPRDAAWFQTLDMTSTLLPVFQRKVLTSAVLDVESALHRALKSGATMDVGAYLSGAFAHTLSTALARAVQTGQTTTTKATNNAKTTAFRVVLPTNTLSIPTDVCRVSTYHARSGASNAHRNLNFTQALLFCPVHSPEGENTGLLRDLALTTHVRIGIETAVVRAALWELVVPWAVATARVPADVPVAWLLAPYAPGPSSAPPWHTDGTTLLTPPTTLVWINGEAVAWTAAPAVLFQLCVAAKVATILPPTVSIYEQPSGIALHSDSGVPLKPLLRVAADGLAAAVAALRASAASGEELWQAALRHGALEYCDAWELLRSHRRVAYTAEDWAKATAAGDTSYTHMVPHVAATWGMVAAMEVAANHNQATRTTFQAQMGRHIGSLVASNMTTHAPVGAGISAPPRAAVAAVLRGCEGLPYGIVPPRPGKVPAPPPPSRRVDVGESFELMYPQAPLVDSEVSAAFGTPIVGVNFFVAIATGVGGGNQEDALILKESTLQLGAGMFTVLKPYVAALESGEETFENPAEPYTLSGEFLPTVGLRAAADYSQLDAFGLPCPGALVTNGTVLIGKTVTRTTGAFTVGRHDAAAATRRRRATAAAARARRASSTAAGKERARAAKRARRSAQEEDEGASSNDDEEASEEDAVPTSAEDEGEEEPTAAGRGVRTRTDRSVLLTCAWDETYVVTAVQVHTNREGRRAVCVLLRGVMRFEPGSKTTDRHSQKGVTNFAVPDVDMPFVMSGRNAGMRMDAVLNLCSIPSRMTIGKLMEMLLGAWGLEHGTFADATPFSGMPAREVLADLARSGMMMEETMIDGRTGEIWPTPIYYGPCFYQLLTRFAKRQGFARARGPLTKIFGQPTDGRKNDGGMRFGTMEVAAAQASGASYTLKDRIVECSDGKLVWVCLKCHQFVDVPPGGAGAGVRGHSGGGGTLTPHRPLGTDRSGTGTGSQALWAQLEEATAAAQQHRRATAAATAAPSCRRCRSAAHVSSFESVRAYEVFCHHMAMQGILILHGADAREDGVPPDDVDTAEEEGAGLTPRPAVAPEWDTVGALADMLDLKDYNEGEDGTPGVWPGDGPALPMLAWSTTTSTIN